MATDSGANAVTLSDCEPDLSDEVRFRRSHGATIPRDRGARPWERAIEPPRIIAAGPYDEANSPSGRVSVGSEPAGATVAVPIDVRRRPCEGKESISGNSFAGVRPELVAGRSDSVLGAGKREAPDVRVLGLSFSGHGTAMALVEDGEVVAAVNLERLSRVKFALSTVPEYALPLAVVLKQTFGFDKVPPFANFYDVFPQLLHEVCGESTLADANIDLVVKTHDNIRPIPGDIEPYEQFCEYFAGTADLLRSRAPSVSRVPGVSREPLRRRRHPDDRRHG